MSDEWFFESGRKRRPRNDWAPILVVVLIVVNAAVFYYFTDQVNQNISELNAEIETLQFQLNSVNYEISVLRESINIQSQNASKSLERGLSS
jgi:hypothetical protein